MVYCSNRNTLEQGSPKIITLIVLLLIIGGAFAILDKTQVIKYLISSVITFFETKKYLLLMVVTLAFMIFGSILGLYEEVIPLVPITIALSLMLGWDTLVGMGMSILATGFGFSAAIGNPFTIGLAQKLADVPAFSGTWYRLIIFATIYSILITFLILYAKKIEKSPEKSLVYEEDKGKRSCYSLESFNESLQGREHLLKKALIWFVICVSLMFFVIISGIFWEPIAQYGLPLMGLLYLLAGLGTGVLCKVSFRDNTRWFLKGMEAIAPSTLLILLGVSVKHIIEQGHIMDTLLRYASTSLSHTSPYLGVVLIYLLVFGTNFFIASASAKAFLLIPLIIPFSNIIGITKQATITTWAFGDGFSNVMFPTNAVLLIALSIAGVSYIKWFRWIILLQIIVFLITIGFALLAVAFAYGPV